MAIYLDTETTGLSPGYDEIVQIGIVDGAGQVLMNTLVRPVSRKSWPEAEDIHGITPAAVADAPPLSDVLPQLVEIVRGQEVVVYNADFDIGFLPAVAEVAASVHCCMPAFADHYGEWDDYFGNCRWQRLTTAADYVMHDLVDAHDAVADAQACRAVYAYLTDPAERARVDAIRERRDLEREAAARLRRLDQEAYWALRTLETMDEERRVKAQKRASAALMRRLGMPLYRRGREPSPRSDQERRERTEAYARLFFGVPLAVLDYEDRGGRALPSYTSRTQVPSNLKALNHFQMESPWVRDELTPDAYLLTAKTFSWLYDVAQVAAIRAKHPLRRNYWPQAGRSLVTKTQLRKLGFKDQDIAAMPPAVEVESRYWAGSSCMKLRILKWY
jgi:DNA polymerase III epsilon subunit-like protein